MKKAIIIGGGSDMGKAIIEKLSADYQITYTYNTNKDNLPKGRSIQLDITNRQSLATFFTDQQNIDLIVTAAFPFIDTDPASFADYQKMEKFLSAHVAIFTFAKEKLVHGGKLINLLGQSADHGLASAPHYAASFAYLENLGKSYNALYGREGSMMVHNLQLGPVNTSLWSGVTGEARELFEKKVNSFLTAQEVAELIHFLAQMRVVPTKLVWDSFCSLPNT